VKHTPKVRWSLQETVVCSSAVTIIVNGRDHIHSEWHDSISLVKSDVEMYEGIFCRHWGLRQSWCTWS